MGIDNELIKFYKIPRLFFRFKTFAKFLEIKSLMLHNKLPNNALVSYFRIDFEDMFIEDKIIIRLRLGYYYG